MIIRIIRNIKRGKPHAASDSGYAMMKMPAPFARDAAVIRGVRLVSFCAVQDLIADERERALLRDMSAAIHALAEQDADPTALVLLTGVYHDLLRKWGEA
jgi:PKHD-type hydroxylase